jgi:hypothetical protein
MGQKLFPQYWMVKIRGLFRRQPGDMILFGASTEAPLNSTPSPTASPGRGFSFRNMEQSS